MTIIYFFGLTLYQSKVGIFDCSRESNILKLFLFLAFLIQVNLDNNVYKHIHAYMNTCHNNYHVVIALSSNLLKDYLDL